jgi:hypothetical protein
MEKSYKMQQREFADRYLAKLLIADTIAGLLKPEGRSSGVIALTDFPRLVNSYSTMPEGFSDLPTVLYTVVIQI